ncbi:MAPEG family protein [Sphingomonas antarctica]|uniref:hypothetical protein n=1 Tax=Sphingomonas antarctica TaxID=2040274 RepID=UPI0039E8A705
MTIWLAAAVAAIGLFTAVGHSYLSEKNVLRPLFAQEPVGPMRSRATRDVTRVLFHLPSLVWAVLGVAILAARFHGGNLQLSVASALIYAASGIGNLISLRRPHPGGFLLLAAAALTGADSIYG